MARICANRAAALSPGSGERGKSVNLQTYPEAFQKGRPECWIVTSLSGMIVNSLTHLDDPEELLADCVRIDLERTFAVRATGLVPVRK
jgi:hypothetical protein